MEFNDLIYYCVDEVVTIKLINFLVRHDTFRQKECYVTTKFFLIE